MNYDIEFNNFNSGDGNVSVKLKQIEMSARNKKNSHCAAMKTTQRIDVSHLNAGVYFLRFVAESGRVMGTRKVAAAKRVGLLTGLS